MMRCVLESLALAYRAALERTEARAIAFLVCTWLAVAAQ